MKITPSTARPMQHGPIVVDPFHGIPAYGWQPQIQQQQAQGVPAPNSDVATDDKPDAKPAPAKPGKPAADPKADPAPKPGDPPADPPADKPAPKPEDSLPAVNPKTGKPFTQAESDAFAAGLRKEAKEAREAKEAAESAAAQAEATKNAILKAAGLNPDGTPYTEVDPEKLAADLAEKDKTANDTARENIVIRVSSTDEHRANFDALLDSRDFVSKLAAIAPSDRTAVEALVDEYVQKDPARFGATPAAAAASGGAGHTGTPPTNARKSKADALAERFPSGKK